MTRFRYILMLALLALAFLLSAGQMLAADKPLTAQHFSNLAKGGTVTISPGRYVAQFPIVIRGASGELSAYGATFVGSIEFLECKDFVVRGATFDGERRTRGAAWDRPTVRVRACTDGKFEDCRFVDARGDHLYISEASSWLVFTDCDYEDAHRNGVSIINGHHLSFIRPRVRNVNGTEPKAGIDIEANWSDPLGCNHDILIADGDFSDCGGRTILGTGLNPPNRVTVRNNTLAGPVTLVGDDNTVVGNRIDGLGRKEIGIGVGGKRPRVQDNEIVNGKHYAALVTGKDFVVSGNRAINYAHPDRPEKPIWALEE